ncbi:MAG: molybdopterin-guanine dinucleotide biosynthesis protein B [Firmicutes bacterium]|nr:molybdopterin-guanine dinucleotide biosynthesis protein B [Bacillota bacterium]
MTPLIGFAGLKNTGKTTLIARLIAHYHARGLRVGVIKHDAHGFAASPAGTDTAVFAQAGAEALGIASPDGHVACEWRLDVELSLWALAERLGEVDLIFVEGYKQAPIVKWILLDTSQDGIDVSRTAPYVDMMEASERVIGWIVPRLPFSIAGHHGQVYHREDIEGICNHMADVFADARLAYSN